MMMMQCFSALMYLAAYFFFAGYAWLPAGAAAQRQQAVLALVTATGNLPGSQPLLSMLLYAHESPACMCFPVQVDAIEAMM
jgi:hypothetical protein